MGQPCFYKNRKKTAEQGCNTCLALIERKTRLYTAIKMPDRTALSMEIAFGVAASQ